MSQETTTAKGLLARLDFPTDRRQPQLARLVVAAIVALASSLLADAALVAAAEAAFPSTRHFSHFRPGDYGLLTTVGVLAAAAAWPLVTRVTSSPRFVFVRLAVIVTVVLYAPDVYILLKGEPARAVAVLMAMHLCIAVLTYQSLVRIAAVDPDGVRLGAGAPVCDGAGASEVPEAAPFLERRGVWVAMALCTAGEVALGVVALFVLPSSRPSGFLPSVGTAVYLLHAAVGAALVVGAGALCLVARRTGRSDSTTVVAGAIGLAVAGIGGLVAADHHLRLLGMSLMFIGGVTGVLGFGLPAIPPTRLSDYAVGPLEWEERAGRSPEEAGVGTDQWGHPLDTWDRPDP